MKEKLEGIQETEKRQFLPAKCLDKKRVQTQNTSSRIHQNKHQPAFHLILYTQQTTM
jgi:hypothetical protein